MCATCRTAERAGEAFALRAAVADREARIALLEGLLREVVGWITPLEGEPHDATLALLLRRMCAALAVPAAGREGDDHA